VVALAACGAGGSKRVPTGTTASTTTAAQYPSTTSRTSTAGATNVRLPATFTIEAGGKLSPPSVTAPAGVTVDLTVISGDGKSHRVSHAGETLTIPARGRASAALVGLQRGRYVLSVDGAPRGFLIVGGQAGP
jgi:hypothetical protein